MTQMENWKAWVANLGDTIVNSGTPLPASRVVTIDGVAEETSPDAMKGFAIVQAEDLEQAVKIAQSDPFLQSGGTIRVHQMMKM